MPIAYIVSWFVGVSCFSLLIRALRNQTTSGPQLGWLIKSASLLILTVVLELYLPEIGGFISLALWGLLIGLPPMLRSRIQGAIIEVNFKRATAYANLAWFLHPFGEYRELPRQLKQVKAVSENLPGSLNEMLDEIRKLPLNDVPPLYQSAPAMLSVQGRWADIAALWEQQSLHLPLTSQLSSLSLYLRVLGELGRIPELVVLFFDQGSELEGLGTPTYLTALLFVAAFTGREKLVEKLCARPDLNMKPANREFWIATALFAQGKTVEGEKILQTLLPRLDPKKDFKLIQWIRLRQTQPISIASTQLSPHEFRFLDQLEMTNLPREIPRQSNLAKTFGPNFQPRLTYAIGAVIVFFYALEIYLGGSETTEGLFAAGGIHTFDVVMHGEWWRLLTATFVHAGPIHLGMNLMGLYFVGPFVEYSQGRLRFLVIYLFSGVSSTLGVTLLANLGIINHQFLVGASGAIMGLIGATGAIALRSWLRDRGHLAFRQLRAVGFALFIQILFDMSTPQVSSTAHLSGAIAGFLITLILYREK